MKDLKGETQNRLTGKKKSALLNWTLQAGHLLPLSNLAENHPKEMFPLFPVLNGLKLFIFFHKPLQRDFNKLISSFLPSALVLKSTFNKKQHF